MEKVVLIIVSLAIGGLLSLIGLSLLAQRDAVPYTTPQLQATQRYNVACLDYAATGCQLVR